MATYNFPVYSSHDDGDRLVKHINPSKCISVYLNNIKILDYTNKLSDEQSMSSNYWDELMQKRAVEIPQMMFDEYRKEIINQLINY
jgi:hypothetical protein